MSYQKIVPNHAPPTADLPTSKSWKQKAGAGFFFASASVLTVALFSGGNSSAAAAALPFETKSGDICSSPSYSKTTLKLSHSQSFAALFDDNKGEKKWEASDVTVSGGKFWSIADNSWSLLSIDEQLPINSGKNKQIGEPRRNGKEDSGFEGLIARSDPTEFYIMRESIDVNGSGDFHALLLDVKIVDGEEDYQVSRTCVSEVEFEGDSKGFEGAAAVTGSDGQEYIFGLCEGNNCREGKAGKERGNGKVVAMLISHEEMHGYDCVLKTHKILDLPKTAYFMDYSAIAIDDSGKVAVTSQEDSKVWIGELAMDEATGLYDPETSNFVSTEGEVLDFPRDTNCEVIFCNIEGIHFINSELLVAVSDKMKSKGKQNFQCLEYDQSIHVFVRP